MMFHSGAPLAGGVFARAKIRGGGNWGAADGQAGNREKLTGGIGEIIESPIQSRTS